VRQLSAPGRLAVSVVTSLAVAASAGCMSVGDDEGKPAHSPSAGRNGTTAEPDGGTGAGAGVPGGGWYGRTPDGPRPATGPDGKGKGAPPDPSSSVAPPPAPSKGTRPWLGSTAPPGSEPIPTKEPSRPAGPPTPPPPASQAPDPQPDPEPEKPSDPPSASPTADVRVGAMSAADGTGMMKEPMASPQLRPV
jgi:hypothetical protein